MKDLILLALDETPTRQLLSRALRALDYETALASDKTGIEKLMRESNPSLAILSAHFGEENSLPLIENLLEQYPTLPIIYLAERHSPTEIQVALRSGVSAYLEPPIKTDEIVSAIENSLLRAKRMGDWLRRKINQSTTSLEKRLSELEVLLQVSRELTSNLNTDSVLQQVVNAAVELTHAEEGSLLLLDESTNELYMRAGNNFEKAFVDSFRVPLDNSIAGEVVRNGTPLTYNKDRPLKLQTAYFIQALIYVPLKIRDRIVGVLGVDNRIHKMPFSDRDTLLLSLLAEAAATAIENARLYEKADDERRKLEAVITNMNDALLMLDQNSRIQIINRSMAKALSIENPDEVIGHLVTDVIKSEEILNLINIPESAKTRHGEINIEDEHIYSAQNTFIPKVGTAITMQDISHIKEVNRLKDEFVHTVSHDLRSPLTAVLGYAELLERVGKVSSTQKDFIQRIRESVGDITSLIDDLLDLGRIESGFDTERELVNLDQILKYTTQNFESLHQQKEQDFAVELAPNLPPTHGNPLRLRQMCDNLVANAIKYTPKGGKIRVRLRSKGSELILQVSDDGPGIPLEDQHRIFEKFFRAQNALGKETGSGLGLAIVKTIVENHRGRIWVESKLGEGSSFFVVLPAYKENNNLPNGK